MFEKGSYVIYGGTGVCEVVDVTTMDIDGIPKDRLYYVLKPNEQKSGKIYTPVENQKAVLRRIISREEADALIDDIPNIEDVWVPNERQREERYKECIHSCQCSELVKIIKTLYLQRKRRRAQGKKATATDEKYMKIAEENLYSELAVSLGIPKSEMLQYINERIRVKR
ncbi:MAG: CarD family transcriptional regulator [Clostridiales bacterium]|nr:CarD family transcriptional regulator [Clostridiales bacterium]MDY3746045.1 CarD family transcriptional regulator [Lachnospiraceae bacterium]